MYKVNIKGPIISSNEKWIYDWFNLEATCSKDIETALTMAGGDDLEVVINSYGGYVDEGSSIYTMLKDYNGQVTTKIIGMAASAASVIAMGGDIVKISPTARLMIHNASSGVSGDYRDMQHSAEVLQDCNEAIANAYVMKTNKPKDEILNLMDQETYMNAKKAKELGFVDEIMFDTSNRLVNEVNAGMLPHDVIAKMMNMKGSLESNNLDNNSRSDKSDLLNIKSAKPDSLMKSDNTKKEIDLLKQRLVCKSKCISSFLLCQNERMI